MSGAAALSHTARRRTARSFALAGLGLVIAACAPATPRSAADASPACGTPGTPACTDGDSGAGDGAPAADGDASGSPTDAKPADGQPAVDVSAPADAKPSGPIPAKLVAGYLEAWSGVLPDAISPKYDLLYLAFAELDAAGAASIWVAADRATLATQIKNRRQAGKPTLLSLGGAWGAQCGLNTSTEIANFVATVVPLIDEFGFSGIDWDLEADVPGGISVSGLVSASRQLRAHYGGDFAITMAPYDSVQATYEQIAQQLAASGDLTYVGFQFYNGDAIPDAAAVKATLAGWMARTAIGAEQFVMGFWHGPDDWHGLVTPYADMSATWLAVEAAYPGVRGVFTWAVAESDMPGFPFANEMDPVVH